MGRTPADPLLLTGVKWSPLQCDKNVLAGHAVHSRPTAISEHVALRKAAHGHWPVDEHRGREAPIASTAERKGPAATN